MNALKLFLVFFMFFCRFRFVCAAVLSVCAVCKAKEAVLDTACLQIRYKMSFWDENHEARYEDERVVNIGKTFRND